VNVPLHVVPKQTRACRLSNPGPADHQDVEKAVIVVIGLNAIQPPELIGNPGSFAAIFERSVTGITKDFQRLGGIERTDNNVQQSIIVIVIHDRSACLSQLIQPHQMAVIPEPPNVKFRFVEVVKRQQIGRINPIGVFAERHVGDIQQPTNIQIVGKLMEIFARTVRSSAGMKNVRARDTTNLRNRKRSSSSLLPPLSTEIRTDQRRLTLHQKSNQDRHRFVE